MSLGGSEPIFFTPSQSTLPLWPSSFPDIISLRLSTGSKHNPPWSLMLAPALCGLHATKLDARGCKTFPWKRDNLEYLSTLILSTLFSKHQLSASISMSKPTAVRLASLRSHSVLQNTKHRISVNWHWNYNLEFTLQCTHCNTSILQKEGKKQLKNSAITSIKRRIAYRPKKCSPTKIFLQVQWHPPSNIH